MGKSLPCCCVIYIWSGGCWENIQFPSLCLQSLWPLVLCTRLPIDKTIQQRMLEWLHRMQGWPVSPETSSDFPGFRPGLPSLAGEFFYLGYRRQDTSHGLLWAQYFECEVKIIILYPCKLYTVLYHETCSAKTLGRKSILLKCIRAFLFIESVAEQTLVYPA